MSLLMKDFAESKGEELALVDDNGSVSWKELDNRINRLVNGFRESGLEQGDSVAIIAGNRMEWFETSFACAHAGLIYVPVNWHWIADELAYVYEDSGCRAIMVGERFQDEVRKSLDDPRSENVSLVLQAGGTPIENFVAYEEFLISQSDEEPEDQLLGGPMFYTSGTTGRPKGVRSGLTEAGPGVTPDVMQLVAAGFAAMLPVPGVTALCGPVYHSAHWAFSWLPMIAGSSVVMQHKFDPAGLLELIEKHQATNVHLVPTQFKRLLDLPENARGEFKGDSLETVLHGAAPCPPKIKKQMIDWFGKKITEYYGATEGGIISLISSQEWIDRGGSLGKPLETIEVIVVDESGNRCDHGVEGTLYFRNLMGTDFEYHNAPEKTEAAHLEPGVFTFGDIGYLDEDGYLWLSDRKIDMIISGGVNIYPAEIEGVLGGHPTVKDVAVIGIPDEEFGEQVKAIVVADESCEDLDSLEKELVSYCRENLAGYKAPKSIDFLNELPRTGTGKIQKQPLREPYWQDEDRRI